MSPNSSTISEAVNLFSCLYASIFKVNSPIGDVGISGKTQEKDVRFENVSYSCIFPHTNLLDMLTGLSWLMFV
jgi:hypothetical protein